MDFYSCTSCSLLFHGKMIHERKDMLWKRYDCIYKKTVYSRIHRFSLMNVKKVVLYTHTQTIVCITNVRGLTAFSLK